MATEPGLRSIGQIAINAKDLERATAFYRDRLGLRELFTAPGLAFFDCGGVRLMLSGAEEPEFDHPSSILYFKVDDIEASHRALVERGVEFRQPPHVVHRAPGMELWMAFFLDSEGNTLALQCERRV
ncbi:MAG: VOC family protein [Acidobacteriota bacterium]